MGWLFSPQCVRVRLEFVTDLSRVPELVWLERHSFIINLSYASLLYLFGEAWHGSHSSADGFQLVIWGGAVSKVCVYHAVWSANSICHRHGGHPYNSGDNSRNNLLVALFTLGDGWHHNHHCRPYSARHGFRWWEIDINFAALSILCCLGIVWDFRLPRGELRCGVSSARRAYDLISKIDNPHAVKTRFARCFCWWLSCLRLRTRPELVKERPCRGQISRVEPLCEPLVHRSEQVEALSASALIELHPRDAGGRAQLP